MNDNADAVWVQQQIPEYQFLFSGIFRQDLRFCPRVGARTDEEVIAAAHDLKPEHIYFAKPGKTEAELQNTLGRCRFVANGWDELYQIDRIARRHAREGFLTPVGLRVIPERYNDGNQPGIPEKALPELAQKMKALSAISVRGCFVQGEIDGLHGDALGQYFRECYELAKRITVILPCGMPYLCIVGGAEAARRNAGEHPETLEDFLRHANIIAAQNQTAFYAELLIT